MILDEIMAYKRAELRERKRAVPLDALVEQAADRPPPLDFAAALGGAGVSLIAEVKRASPSRGVLCRDLDPARLAATYAGNGAAAVSVLTDSRFFHGELNHLERVRGAVSQAGRDVPVLRKDFIFDPYQVHEARAYGADALLLIAAVLSDHMLGELLSLTHKLGMTALVEVHDADELRRAVRLQPRVIGINNRDLTSFAVDIATFGRLRPLIPAGTIAVSESGVHTGADVRRLHEMGADAVLVGEALVTASDVGAKVRELIAGGAG